MRCDPRNEAWGFWDRWADGRWEPETKAVIEQYVNGGTFVDIGAWIGPTALWALPHAGRVVCVEPDPTAFDMLVENVPDVEHVNAAIAGHTGTTTITAAGDSESRIGTGDHEVLCFTIEDFFMVRGITSADLIKIDIEGAEREVITQAEPFLRKFGAPIALSLHWAPWPDEYLPGWNVQPIAPGVTHEVLAIP